MLLEEKRLPTQRGSAKDDREYYDRNIPDRMICCDIRLNWKVTSY